MKKRVLLICLVLMTVLSSVALAAVPFQRFKLVFEDLSKAKAIVTDTTSKAMAKGGSKSYARLYITSQTGWGDPFSEMMITANNIYRAYENESSKFVTTFYYEDVTGETSPRLMHYTKNIDKSRHITLYGRPDSSIPSTLITGKFGAG